MNSFSHETNDFIKLYNGTADKKHDISEHSIKSHTSEISREKQKRIYTVHNHCLVSLYIYFLIHIFYKTLVNFRI